MDPDQVGSCGPGVQSIDVVDEDHFNARAKVGVGFITATFNVNLAFVERVPLERARISARGQAPGSAVDGVGEMVLRDGPNNSTVMDWSADVNISGTLASVGARLIEGTAQKLIGQSFTCIKTKLRSRRQPERLRRRPWRRRRRQRRPRREPRLPRRERCRVRPLNRSGWNTWSMWPVR
jgi:carbon monoxide dehydrogenase subunit G